MLMVNKDEYIDYLPHTNDYVMLGLGGTCSDFWFVCLCIQNWIKHSDWRLSV